MRWSLTSEIAFRVWDEAVVAYHGGSGATHFFDGIEAWMFEQLAAGPQTLGSLRERYVETVEGGGASNLELILSMFARLGIVTELSAT